MNRSTCLFRRARRLLVLVGLAVTLPATAQAVDIQVVRGESGVTAWLVEDRANPILAMDVWWRGGAAQDPDGKEGLAEFLAATLDEGAGDLDSQAFRRALEDRSISLGFSASRDGFSGSVKTLTKHREEAFRLFRLALTESRFDQEPVERIRAQILSGLKRAKTQPRSIATETWWAAAFPEHPYGRPPGGSLESIGAISDADLRAARGRLLGRNNLIVSVVGDISAEELAPLLDQTFGALPARAAATDLVEATPDGAGGVIVVPLDVPQSTALFGHVGLKRDDADYYTATVMNYILGGGSFASRLYAEVREVRGLAYSVYSYLHPLQAGGLLKGGVATQNARMAESLAVISAEWTRLRDQGPTPEEVRKAINNITGAFALRLTSTSGIAGVLSAVQIHDLGLDYIDQRAAIYKAVTVEDVRRVARRLLRPEALLTVVVGAPEDVSPSREIPKPRS